MIPIDIFIGVIVVLCAAIVVLIIALHHANDKADAHRQAYSVLRTQIDNKRQELFTGLTGVKQHLTGGGTCKA